MREDRLMMAAMLLTVALLVMTCIDLIRENTALRRLPRLVIQEREREPDNA